VGVLAMTRRTPISPQQALDALRRGRAAELIEGSRAVDPTTGQAVPAFEPDPAIANVWRKTEAARRAEVSSEILRNLAAGGAIVVNVNRRDDQDLIAWARAAGRYTYVGRPFHIGRDGTRAEVIALYEAHVRGRPGLLPRLPELRGKVLGCWCRPRPCHAGVLVKLLGEMPR
jgi:hypothetical protein